MFISGRTMNKSNNERDLFGRVFDKVLCSRSPAMVPEDFKILSVLGEKPEDMSDGEWDLLCSYKFGTIIFGTPRTSSTPLPCIIADGDLDGDLYFICWDEKILSHLLYAHDSLTTKSRDLLLKLELPEKSKKLEGYLDKSTDFSEGDKEDWLSLAQDKMLDFSTHQLAGALVGTLYRLCEEYSDIYNEDACAYGQAYKDSMDIQKHGGKVYLPEHLHENVPEKFRPLLLCDANNQCL